MDFPRGLYIDAPDRTVCQYKGIVSVVSDIDDLREELRVANARVTALQAQLVAAQAAQYTAQAQASHR
jgi:ribosomal protein S5